jgi:hypothetical protein
MNTNQVLQIVQYIQNVLDSSRPLGIDIEMDVARQNKKMLRLAADEQVPALNQIVIEQASFTTNPLSQRHCGLKQSHDPILNNDWAILIYLTCGMPSATVLCSSKVPLPQTSPDPRLLLISGRRTSLVLDLVIHALVVLVSSAHTRC